MDGVMPCDRSQRAWFKMWGTPGEKHFLMFWRWWWVSHSWDVIGGGGLFTSEERGHSSSKDSGSPSKFSFLWHALFLMCTHINKAKSAGTESADCVTVWPLGQASFLVPPVLTLACERLKLFQIFPLNIYPAWTSYGTIPGTRMDPGFQ